MNVDVLLIFYLPCFTMIKTHFRLHRDLTIVDKTKNKLTHIPWPSSSYRHFEIDFRHLSGLALNIAFEC